MEFPTVLQQHHPSPIDPQSSFHSPVPPRIIVFGGIEYDYEDLEQISHVEFCRFAMEGRWEAVAYTYQKKSEFHKIDINGRGTALHMAVNNGNEEAVKNLVAAILEHEGTRNETTLGEESALRVMNEKGASPLHLAASRGFTSICQCIIGENGERNHLVQVKNGNGETPLFWAVLNGRNETFEYLRSVSPIDFAILITNKHDSILHCAIRKELFDLATYIIRCYPQLSHLRNDAGGTPLQVLATKPSAFMSGVNLPWWKRIIYHCKSVTHG